MNNGFDETFIQQLKQKNDIVTVMSRYLTLTQKGKNFWTCCPFHNERTPSMCVNPFEQFYHCFGCKEHGDVITFVEKMESCDFMTAVEILAKSAGMEIPTFKTDQNVQKRKKQKEAVLNILAESAKHYEQNLYEKTSKQAQEYVKSRKFTRKSLEEFHIGYSKNWTDIVQFLKTKGFSYEDMIASGVVEYKNKYYDTFGERLIFPIYNLMDECVGFSARSLVPTNYAKYKNSPNNLVFDKSKIMFGMNFLRKLKQQHELNYIIIVEGQMDVVALHQAGFYNCVACLGTALTPFHAKQLKYLCDYVIVSLDGDSAGQNASMKTIDTLVEGGLNVKAIKIPEKKDPDEYIRAYGKDAYQKLLDNALDYVVFKIHHKLEQYDLSKIDQKAKFVNTAISIVNELKTSSEKQLYLDEIKKLTDIPIDVLKRDLTTTLGNDTKQEQPEVDYFENAVLKSIKFILASLCFKKDYANYDFDLSNYLTNPSYKKLYKVLKSYHDENKPFLISNLFDDGKEDDVALGEILDYNFEDIQNPAEYFKQCIWKVRENYLKNKSKELTKKLESCSNDEKSQIYKEISDIQKKLREKILED